MTGNTRGLKQLRRYTVKHGTLFGYATSSTGILGVAVPLCGGAARW